MAQTRTGIDTHEDKREENKDATNGWTCQRTGVLGRCRGLTCSADLGRQPPGQLTIRYEMRRDGAIPVPTAYKMSVFMSVSVLRRTSVLATSSRPHSPPSTHFLNPVRLRCSASMNIEHRKRSANAVIPHAVAISHWESNFSSAGCGWEQGNSRSPWRSLRS